jgi:hypothetical protein
MMATITTMIITVVHMPALKISPANSQEVNPIDNTIIMIMKERNCFIAFVSSTIAKALPGIAQLNREDARTRSCAEILRVP